jgi:outer membrane immunogenic protein
MRKLSLAVAAAAVFISTPAFAQDEATAPVGEPAAPDGSRAFGIEPYVGIMGGYEWFDNQRTSAGIPQPANGGHYDGALVQGVAGVNVPLGPLFVGAEGNVIKGVKGDIDWQYGAAGRFGVRAGESGMVYGKVGYQWVNFAQGAANTGRDYDEMTYGIGVEVGPKSIGLGGITGASGVRLRVEANTFGSFKSLRPMAGLIAHF